MTRIAPFSWGASFPLDSKSCYLLLVTYQTGASATAASVESLTLDKLSAAAGCLTPRGLRHAFSWSAQPSPSALADSPRHRALA